MSKPAYAAYPHATAEQPVEVLVEILAAGGPRLGFGHVGRCLALWEELGGRAAFNAQDDTVVDFLRARGAPIAPVASAPIVLLDSAQPTTEREVRSLQAPGRRVVLLDDLGAGRMAADMVIDPPTAAAWPPARGTRLAGFEHVLLRREVREAAAAASPRQGVLLSMGGSDPAGLTPALGAALVASGIATTVALGPGYRGPTPAATVVESDAFVGALARAELLVTGYGHSLLEAAHLGVPAISVVYREEHLPHARAFCQNGTACLLEMTEGARPAELVELAGGLLGDPERLERIAARGRGLVDGAGAARIAVALRALV
jgi:spore coat polysaccharide biosynthesis predicted glycosyltransferase SpsG